MALGTAATVAIAAVVAGAVGAGTVLVLGQPPSAPGAVPPPSDRSVALLAQLDRQEKDIAALRARIEEASAARAAALPASAPGGPGATAHRDPGSGQPTDPATLGALLDPGASPAPAADVAAMAPEERAKYEAVYKAMREKEQEEARKARTAAFETGLRARLDRLPATLGLTPEQKDAAVKILMDRGEKLREAFAATRTAGDADAYRAAQEKADAIRKEAKDALALALTAEQAKAVEDATDRGGAANRNRMNGGRRTPRDLGGGGGGAGGGGADGAGNPPR
jgi:hypothetical protein